MTTKLRRNITQLLHHRTVFTTQPAKASILPKTPPNSEEKASFYQRPLPKELVELNSPNGKALFKSAMLGGFAESYFSSVGNFTNQSETAFCGISSLVMALNTLQVDPLKKWKGVWRWYHENHILEEACIPSEHILKNGVTYEQFNCLSKRHCNVTSHRSQFKTEEEFRNDVKRVCKTNHEMLIVNFDRKTLGQTGQGHFSPIGAYDPTTDSVLVLDVARFKYPPYFVKLSKLFESMKVPDPKTKGSRGWFVLSPLEAVRDRSKSCSRSCLSFN